MAISESDIIDLTKVKKDILQENVNIVKAKVHDALSSAVESYYSSASPGTYGRTNSFSNFANVVPTESWSEDSVSLTFTFDSGMVSVNSWNAPWGTTYPGDSEQAFTKAYDFGLHGGPKPVWNSHTGYNFGSWTWGSTQMSEPLGRAIERSLLSIEI